MTKQQYKADLRYFLDQIIELKKQPIEEIDGFDSNGTLLNIGDMVNISSSPGYIFTVTGFGDSVIKTNSIYAPHYTGLITKYVNKNIDINGVELMIGDKFNYHGEIKVIEQFALFQYQIYIYPLEGKGIFKPSEVAKHVKPVKLSRWKPEKGGYYCYIDSLGDINECHWDVNSSDNKLYDMGNVYRTYKDAEQALNQHLLLVKMQDFADQDTGEDYTKSQVYYNLDKKMFQSSSFIYPMLPIVFKTLGQSKLIEKAFGTDLDIFK